MPIVRIPRATTKRAPLPSSLRKSRVNSFWFQSSEFRVLRRTRSAPEGMSIASRSDYPMESPEIDVPSTTTAGPQSASRDTLSIPGAPSMKCTGASTWVPVCTPNESLLTLA